MWRVALAFACLALASTAGAGLNPDARIFLEFEGGGNTVEPPYGGFFTATVYVEGLGFGSGVTAVEFTLSKTFGGYVYSFAPLLQNSIYTGPVSYTHLTLPTN